MLDGEETRDPTASPDDVQDELLRLDTDALRGVLLRATGLDTEGPQQRRIEAGDSLDEFQLVEVVGRGGMGVVYRAFQHSLGRDVAIKVMRSDFDMSTGTRDRFDREAAIIARLDHPSILPLHACGESDGVVYLVMPFIEGITLAQLIDALRKSVQGSARDLTVDHAVEVMNEAGATVAPAWCRGSWREAAVRLVYEVGSALAHAHERGIVHRDVKPSNVMLSVDGRVLLFDFGLAMSGESQPLTATGVAFGSFGYAAPEQVSGEVADARADVFSLGAVFYEMLTLQAPFHAERVEAAIHRTLNHDPESVRRRNPTVSVELDAIVVKSLEKSPARRYATASDLRADLLALLELRPVSAARATLLRHVIRAARREPVKATALVAGLIIAVATALSLPLVMAGLARQREVSIERELAAGALDWFEGRNTDAETHFRNALRVAGGDQAEALGAIALLEGRSDDVGEQTLRSATDLWIDAVPRIFAGVRDDESGARRAVTMVEQAVVSSPRARLVFHITWACAAVKAGDRRCV